MLPPPFCVLRAQRLDGGFGSQWGCPLELFLLTRVHEDFVVYKEKKKFVSHKVVGLAEWFIPLQVDWFKVMPLRLLRDFWCRSRVQGSNEVPVR